MAAFFISIRGKSTIGFLSLGWEGNELFPEGEDLSSIQEPPHPCNPQVSPYLGASGSCWKGFIKIAPNSPSREGESHLALQCCSSSPDFLKFLPAGPFQVQELPWGSPWGSPVCTEPQKCGGTCSGMIFGTQKQ